VDVTVEKLAMIGIEHDLANGRTGAFRHHAIDHAFAFRHPGSGKTHTRTPPFAPVIGLFTRLGVNVGEKTKKTVFIQWFFTLSMATMPRN
jgi:hypothetical protein